VRRRIPGETSFGFIGVTGTKTFTDSTFAAGPDTVEYTVQGARSGVSGPLSNIFLIRFGSGEGGAGDGSFQAFVTEQPGTGGSKMAA
jgi:hypothetical protein